MLSAINVLNASYAVIPIAGVALVAVYSIKKVARSWGMRWRAGDPCPHCGKPLEAGAGRLIVTLGRRVPWLRCEGWPRCDFVTRRIAMPVAANENARQRFGHQAFDQKDRPLYGTAGSPNLRGLECASDCDPFALCIRDIVACRPLTFLIRFERLKECQYQLHSQLTA